MLRSLVKISFFFLLGFASCTKPASDKRSTPQENPQDETPASSHSSDGKSSTSQGKTSKIEDIQLSDDEIVDLNYASKELLNEFSQFMDHTGYPLKAGGDQGKLVEKFLKDPSTPKAFSFYYAAGLAYIVGKEVNIILDARPDLDLREDAQKLLNDPTKGTAIKTGAIVGTVVGGLGFTIMLFDIWKRQNPTNIAILSIGMGLLVGVPVGIFTGAGTAIAQAFSSPPLPLEETMDQKSFLKAEKSYVYCKFKDQPWDYYKHRSDYFEVIGKWGTIEVSGKKIYAFATLESALSIADRCAEKIRKYHKEPLDPTKIEYVVGNSYKYALYPLAFYVQVENDKAMNLNSFLRMAEKLK